MRNNLPGFKNPPNPPLPVLVYRTCAEMPFDRFVRCMVNDDLTAMIISGNPATNELQTVWNDILTEYAELIDSEHYKRVFRLTKEINYLQSRFSIIETIIKCLEVGYSAYLVGELKKLGYPGQYDWSLQDRYQKELKAAYSKAKVLLSTSEGKRKELEEIEKKSVSGKIDRKYFDTTLINLSQFMKYQVKASEITVQQYCLMTKEMARFIELQNRNNGRQSYK